MIKLAFEILVTSTLLTLAVVIVVTMLVSLFSSITTKILKMKNKDNK